MGGQLFFTQNKFWFAMATLRKSSTAARSGYWPDQKTGDCIGRIGPVRKTFPESRLQIFRPPLGWQCRWLLYNVSSFTCSREFLNFTSTNFQARVNLFHSYPFSILMMKLFSHLRSSNVSGPWKNISIPTRFVAFDILICSENISNHKIEKKQQRGNVMKHWTSVIY